MYRSLLVPLDGSSFGEQALPLALSLTRRAGAALHLAYVIPPPAAIYPEALFAADAGLEAQLRARQKDYLGGVAKRVEALAPVRVQVAVLDGPIAPTLHDHVAAVSADLVVMTTHGRSAAGRFWLGSVADHLVRHLTVPVLMIRPHDSAPDWDSDPIPRHILLPLDGTPLAEEMIEPASSLAALAGADFTLLRVLRPVLPSPLAVEGVGVGPGTEEIIAQIQRVHEQLRTEAESYLEGIARRLRGQGHPVRTRIAFEEQPALAILNEAVPPAIDLVALQTHGRGGLARLLLGSVADKVIRGAAVPVLIQRPAKV
jgi:nucleotide-binding universal stress UspA family protein